MSGMGKTSFGIQLVKILKLRINELTSMKSRKVQLAPEQSALDLDAVSVCVCVNV